MKSSRLRPGVVIRWGIVISVGGALLIVLVPMFAYQMYATPNGVDQGLIAVIQTLVSVANIVLPPLGAALIGAGLVILYIEKNATRDREHSFQLGRRDASQ
ncbi:MAG TPA: hypothetical protein VGO31_08475 [Microbacteriaceae bacterium]|jgi:hypothetical protein|nr:hypothetical protein [Microbacteriaceae bacterium]